MKKLTLILMVMAMVFVLVLPALAETTFKIDFEKPEIIGYKTISFEGSFDSKISIEPQDGFTGNAYKVGVLPKNESDTWWSTGLAFTADSSKAENFRNLTSMSFKYKLTSDLSDTDVCIQLVWKDTGTKADGSDRVEVAKMENIPIKLVKGDIQTYTVDIPKDIADKLNAAKDCHFDWFFIHYVNQAGASFKPGNLIIDDITFNAAAASSAGSAQTAAASNPKTGDVGMLPYALIGLASSGALAGLKLRRKSK